MAWTPTAPSAAAPAVSRSVTSRPAGAGAAPAPADRPWPGAAAAPSPGVGWTAQPDQPPVAASAESAEPAELAPAWAPIAAEVPAGTAPSVSGDRAADETDEEVERRPRHPYTWLHLIVLALVAFVLGFLIMLLVVNGRPDNSASAPSSSELGVSSTSPPL